jgi:hypothetical protein
LACRSERSEESQQANRTTTHHEVATEAGAPCLASETWESSLRDDEVVLAFAFTFAFAFAFTFVFVFVCFPPSS